MSNKQPSAQRKLRWKTRWVLWRNGVLGSRAFQNWASRAPIFRSVARRRASAQFDLLAGFIYSQILWLWVDTGLIGFLAERPRTPGEVRDFLGLGQEASDRLLAAGRALELAETPQDQLWTLGEAGASLSANDGAMAMIRHHQLLYRDLSDPRALLAATDRAGTELAQFWTYSRNSPDQIQRPQSYSDLMATTQPMVWGQILHRYPFSRHRRMLDVGGGSGAFVEAVAKVAPNLELGIFDLPAVTPLAQARFDGSAQAGRVSIHSGSFRTDPIPTGFDLVTLVRILHDHDDDVALSLLQNIHESLLPGGTVLIVEPMADTPSARKMGEGYFGFYLWAMGSGRPRSIGEIGAMLAKAGFATSREISTDLPIICRAIAGTKTGKVSS